MKLSSFICDIFQTFRKMNSEHLKILFLSKVDFSAVYLAIVQFCFNMPE